MVNRIVVLISLIFTATIILIGMLTFKITYSELMTNKMQETTLKAESISKDVKMIFDEAKLMTQQLAIHPEVQAYLKAAVSRETVVANPYFKETLNTLVQTQKSGQVYYLAWVANEQADFYLDSSGVIPDETYDIKKRPWYQVAINAKDTAFTPPYIEWATKRVVISCVKPLREDGKRYGFVVMDFVLEKIPIIFENAKITTTDKNFLISSDGSYIYHDNPDQIMKANINQTKDPLYPYLNQIKESTSELTEIQYEGKAYYLDVYPVDENGWKVITLIDKAAIQGHLREIGWLIIGLLALIFMGTLVVVHSTVKKTM
jgi:methyl-accepting chemotaxis protein